MHLFFRLPIYQYISLFYFAASLIVLASINERLFAGFALASSTCNSSYQMLKWPSTNGSFPSQDLTRTECEQHDSLMQVNI